ncbi:hypothetical protein [Pyxidicoccus xibeiensis]|uniref:hypothetical protein n=1 Tax=Pyxidicoccus xibeiensis TaxID=2906759 RepID=UPI0020A72CF2|nr:hypothetical protein [Pyxidicoccus xibeiensis]MCP3136814.1 hypothetical protein [Pyxidicoccus xibeiensis]
MSRKNGEPGDVYAEALSRFGSGVRPMPGAAARADVRPLPGSAGADVQPDWIDVTVMPREEPQAPPAYAPALPPLRSRAEVHQSGLAESARFYQSFMRWIEAHQLQGAVRSVSEPGSLPMLHLRCAPRVLDQLRRTPEFEAGAMMPIKLV